MSQMHRSASEEALQLSPRDEDSSFDQGFGVSKSALGDVLYGFGASDFIEGPLEISSSVENVANKTVPPSGLEANNVPDDNVPDDAPTGAPRVLTIKVSRKKPTVAVANVPHVAVASVVPNNQRVGEACIQYLADEETVQLRLECPTTSKRSIWRALKQNVKGDTAVISLSCLQLWIAFQANLLASRALQMNKTSFLIAQRCATAIQKLFADPHDGEIDIPLPTAAEIDAFVVEGVPVSSNKRARYDDSAERPQKRSRQ